MISLAQKQAITPAAPALMFIGQNQGQVVPATSLSFRILDLTSDENEQQGGVQVFPVTADTWQPVDLVNDVVVFDANAQNGAGTYCARWTVPDAAPVGKYAIEWQYALVQPVSTVFTSSFSEPPPSGITRKFFEVLATATVLPGPQYALVADVRQALGCSKDKVTDLRLLRIIKLASAMVERITGRYFDARAQVHRYGGNSARILQVGQPIVGLTSVGIDTQPTQQGDLVVDLAMLRIYNRHLSQGMTLPDDRENPKLEFVHSDDLYGIRFVPFRGISLRSLAWPIGVQNVHVRGYFGFTEPDGSPWGETPLLLQHAISLIAARELPKIGDRDEREDAQWRWRVTADQAKEIRVEMADPRKWGEWFGDPEIDSILSSYIRPPELGSA